MKTWLMIRLQFLPIFKTIWISIEPVFDFLVAGEGYYALDLLMKTISLSMNIDTQKTNKNSVIQNLSELSSLSHLLPGNSVIVGINQDNIHAWPIFSNIKLDLSVLPSPYSAFAIRAMFPIFQSNHRVLHTAHLW